MNHAGADANSGFRILHTLLAHVGTLSAGAEWAAADVAMRHSLLPFWDTDGAVRTPERARCSGNYLVL